MRLCFFFMSTKILFLMSLRVVACIAGDLSSFVPFRFQKEKKTSPLEGS